MDKVHGVVAWYQQKIGYYDRQLWEQSVEQKVLKPQGIKQAPRRSVRPKTDLIDVDLVRGSSFVKVKPQVPWTYITITTFSRVVLFPFHYRWWIQQTSFPFFMVLLVLYMMQIFTIIIFFNNVGGEIMQNEQYLSEVAIPCVLMVLLGLIHSQTVLTHLKPPLRDNKRELWRRKRSLSQNRGSNSAENCSPNTQAPNPESVPSGTPSYSNLKGPSSSRSQRERTKERKIRLKTAPRSRRGTASDRDSESAYHTHEASDSVPDRTSSMEQDSNSSEMKIEKSTDLKRLQDESRSQKKESQESDMPEDSDSTSDQNKLLKANTETSNKRNSQSISSDEVEEDVVVKREGISQKGKITIEKIPDKVSVTEKVSLCEDMSLSENMTLSKKVTMPDKGNQYDKVIMDNRTEGLKQIQSHFTDFIDFENHSPVEIKQVEDDGSTIYKLAQNDIKNVNCDINNEEQNNSEVSDNSFVNINIDASPVSDSSQQGLSCPQVKTKSDLNLISCNSCPEHETVGADVSYGETLSVKFNKELLQREITPNCSREGTPTHTQSDILLQSKHIRSTSKPKSKTDTETESESDAGSPKMLSNVLRRKVTYSDSTENNVSVLRNRRHNSILGQREQKSSLPRVSSSEGETEGQSSEYSRSSRRTMASSDEWGDHLQSDVDTSSETSSCGTSPEISDNEEPKVESDTDFTQGMTASNIHVLNILQPSSNGQSIHGTPDKVTCIIWERNECKKVELTAMDIGWAIIETVDKIPESSDYILIGFAFSLIMGLCPFLFSTFHSKDLPNVVSWEIVHTVWESLINNTWRLNLMHLNAAFQRLWLSCLFFFMLSVADRTFKQRLLYAKHFCYLTSSRRARKFDMPHFRLNKVRNIRTWLSLRSYLKKRGPQRSVDVIVSAAFLLTLIMLVLMCLQLLRDPDTYLDHLCNWELLVWCMALGVYLLRFMTLGLRINKKYRNLSVLITEQINLYLQMEQKPHKKEELMVANNVLKLAESLLKELESPFKISGISANPFILNFTKVVILSAFSGVLTELLGFKLKLYKIKLKA